jgi:hypothetical protein
MQPLTLLFATPSCSGLPVVRCLAGNPDGLDLARLGQTLASQFALLARGQRRAVRFGGQYFRVAIQSGTNHRVPELVLTEVRKAPGKRQRLQAPAVHPKWHLQGWQACLKLLSQEQCRAISRVAATARGASEPVAVLAVRGYLALQREKADAEQARLWFQTAQLLDRWMAQHL